MICNVLRRKKEAEGERSTQGEDDEMIISHSSEYIHTVYWKTIREGKFFSTGISEAGKILSECTEKLNVCNYIGKKDDGDREARGRGGVFSRVRLKLKEVLCLL